MPSLPATASFNSTPKIIVAPTYSLANFVVWVAIRKLSPLCCEGRDRQRLPSVLTSMRSFTSTLAQLYEKGNDFAASARAYERVVDLLDRPAPVMEAGKLLATRSISKRPKPWSVSGEQGSRPRRSLAPVTAFEHAKKKDPIRGPRLSFHLAGVYEEQGKLVEVLAQVEAYLKGQPPGVEGYEARIRCNVDLAAKRLLSATWRRRPGTIRIISPCGCF